MSFKRSVLEQLLMTSSRCDGARSLLDDVSLYRIQISAHGTFPISFEDLERMDADHKKQRDASASFAKFVVRANAKFAMYVIEQQEVNLATTQSGRPSFSLALSPADAHPELLEVADWLCKEKSSDAYLVEIDTLLTASDEFNCFAISTRIECMDAISQLAIDVGLNTRRL
jgi:hypothetical protein